MIQKTQQSRLPTKKPEREPFDQRKMPEDDALLGCHGSLTLRPVPRIDKAA
ncbi:MAG: hypothetical protein ABL974_00460 [Prosthecobacter sp.]